VCPAVMANSIAVLTFYHRVTVEHRGIQNAVVRELYFLRSTRYLASSFNVSARSPKLPNSAKA
jgi:hypothetical protein